MREVAKTDINPSTGKAYGINPNTGQWDDNYWATQVDPVVNAQAKQVNSAQAAYQAGIGSAVSGLQQQGTNLDTQYQTLLANVKGEGSAAYNTATSSENAYLGARGLQSQAGIGADQLSQTQNTIQQQNMSQQGSLGFTEAQLQNNLAANIASLKAGGAGTMAQLPLNYGSLALAQAANVANIGLAGAQASQAQTGARYITIPGVGVVDLNSGQLVGGVTNNNLQTGGYGILAVK